MLPVVSCVEVILALLVTVALVLAAVCRSKVIAPPWPTFRRVGTVNVTVLLAAGQVLLTPVAPVRLVMLAHTVEVCAGTVSLITMPVCGRPAELT